MRFVAKQYLMSKILLYVYNFLHYPIYNSVWRPLLCITKFKRFWNETMKLCNISWVTSPNAFWILVVNSCILLGWLSYTLLLIYPNKKKSHGVRSGDLGGHLILRSVSAPLPIHLFGSFSISQSLTIVDQCGELHLAWKRNLLFFGNDEKVGQKYGWTMCRSPLHLCQRRLVQ